MLKIWKQAWKKDDSVRRAHQPEEANDSDCHEHARLSGANTSSLSVELDGTLSSDSMGSNSTFLLSDDHSKGIGYKRKREPSLDGQSDKKRRTDEIHDDSDASFTYNPLAGLTDANLTYTMKPSTEIHIEEQVFQQTLRENTIAIASSVTAEHQLASQFLANAVQLERELSLDSPLNSQRTALFLFDDDRSIAARIAALSAGGTLTVIKFTEDMYRPNVFERDNLLLNDIVVVSCNVLLECLIDKKLDICDFHAILISDIHILKDQESHPVMRIMKEFYLSCSSLSQRPKLLAVALLNTGRTGFFDSSMLKLEDVFEARIFGVSESKRAEILALPDLPSDMIVLHDPPLRTVETQLFRQLHELDPLENLFHRHFKSARAALTEVGACGADLIWRRALREMETSISLNYDEDDDSKPSMDQALQKTKMKMKDKVKNWIFSMPNLDHGSLGFNVTPKFLRLVDILGCYEPYGDTFRGIVFVRRRATALLIVDLLRTLDEGDGFLRPCALVGHISSSSQEHYEETIRCFANGTCNLLVATKSAEDLDLAKACVVICFDLFESNVSYAYMRSRTRGRESHFIHMVERRNDIHRRVVSRNIQLDERMESWLESVFASPSAALPPPTLHETTNPYHSDSDDEDDPDKGLTKYIEDPTTGCMIYVQDATTVMYRFLSRLGSHDKDSSHGNLFVYTDVAGVSGSPRQVVCQINLSQILPLSRIAGSPCTSLSLARRAACFEACRQLFVLGLLDSPLFPRNEEASKADSSFIRISDTYHGNPSLPQATLSELQLTGTRRYPRKRPDFWTNAVFIPGGRLYPTIIHTDVDISRDMPHAPIIILTWQPLPQLASFKLFFSGLPTRVHFERGLPFDVDEGQLYDIHMYTIRVCRAIGNKPFDCPLEKMPYFFLPVQQDYRELAPAQLNKWTPATVIDFIPWDAVALCARHWAVPLCSDSVESLSEDIYDAVVQDRWVEFTRRYAAVRVRPDMTPLSRPMDSPREAGYENLVEYCKARRKDFNGLKNYDQPLIEVKRMPSVFNTLDPASRPVTLSPKAPVKYLIPELCAKFTIPASTLRTALLLPSIMRRIDDLLIVKELNARLFDHAIMEHHLHAAVTAPSAGMEFDYERLELLGDAFLKYLTTVYVFVTNPTQTEGLLHQTRQKLISNRSLLHNANEAGLPIYIQAKPFTFKLWSPPNFIVVPPPSNKVVEQSSKDVKAWGTGTNSPAATDDPAQIRLDSQGPLSSVTPERNLSENHKQHSRDEWQMGASEYHNKKSLQLDAAGDNQVATDTIQSKKRSWKGKKQEDIDSQRLGDKAVADVAEAIIGAAYVSGGQEIALRAAKALNVAVPRIDQWSDFGRKILAPPPDVTARLRAGSIDAVENIIGHKFSCPHILAQALTHASIQGYEATSYERLEFLGDAILDFMVIRHIYDRDTQLSPGALTLLKGAMVSNSALAAVCVWSKLHEHLLFESYTLATSIQNYADQIKVKQGEEYKLARQEGRSPGQYWLDIDPPKALSDVIESIIGAVYISDNFSSTGAESLYHKILKPFYDQHVTLKTLSYHPTKILFELLQAQGCQEFEIVKEKDEQSLTQCDVVVHDVILASATDRTASLAARRASLLALDALEGEADFMTRTCDCRTHAQSQKTQRGKFDKMLSGLGDEDEDLVVVESELTGADNADDSIESSENDDDSSEHE